MEASGSHPTREEGLRLIKAGDYKLAVATLDRVVEADPSDAQAFLYLGVAYAEMGSKAESIAAFEQSVSVKPTPKAHYNLGVAYQSVERLGEAMTQFQNAVRLDNSYKAALVAIEQLKKQGVQPKESSVQWTIGAQSVAEEMAARQAQQTQPLDQTQHIGQPQTQAPVSNPTTAVPPAYAPGNLQSQLQQTTHRPYLPGELEAKKEAELHQHQMQMTKSGLLYGMVFGPIGLMGGVFLFRFMVGPIGFGILPNLIAGIIVGAAIGAICGFTGGGEETGQRVGALVFGIFGIVVSALSFSGIGIFILQVVIFAALGFIVGLFVGRMVDASIGWD